MPPTLAERLADAARRLDPVSETPRLDAEILLAHALGISTGELLARVHQSIDAPCFPEMLERRIASEPVAYILGEWEFFSLPLYVEAPMLVPRPETEHLVEEVLDRIQDTPSRVLDLGTGTGCVAVAVAANAPEARVTAVDINPAAVALARRNAERNGVAERVEVHEGDLFDALPPDTPSFDFVCSNPPYIEEEEWEALAPDIRLYEDPRALLAGADGLDVIRRIAADSLSRLCPGGRLALEIGMGQYEAVAAILGRCGYRDIGFRKDLAGIPRIINATRLTER